MPDGNEPVAIKVLGSIGEISAEAWDACAGAGNPFTSHGFLAAVEDSGSAAAETGWEPRHLCLEDKSGVLIGAVPMYLKGHSYGEYVFDWGWGDAYERAGGHYYPKLQAAIPFTPVTGPRLLVRDTVAPEMRHAVIKTLTAGLIEVAKRLEVSSVHVTFPTEDQWHGLGAEGFLQREGKQFFWHNPGYDGFDDFLASLASRKRKMIRRERRDALAHPRHSTPFSRLHLRRSSLVTGRTRRASAVRARSWSERQLGRVSVSSVGACIDRSVPSRQVGAPADQVQA